MKKQITTILAAALAIFVYCSSNAMAAAGPNLSKTFADKMKSGNYFMKYTVETDMGGQKIVTKMTMGSKGKVIGSESIMESMNMKMRSLIKDNKMYTIDDAAKTYRVMDMPKQQGGEQAGYDSLKFVGSGTDKVGGKSLPYEEYQNGGTTIRYFFEGNKLFAIVTKAAGATTTMLITEFSDNPPASLMEIPQDYKAL